MGQLRLPTPSDQAAFPGAKQIAQGTIPLLQCTQAREHGYHAIANSTANLIRVFLPYAWTPNEHLGKTCFYREMGGIWTSMPIISNSDVTMYFVNIPFAQSDVHWYIDDGPGYEDQQSAESFMEDALDAGYAATRKGGLVITDSPLTPRNEQCFLLSDPL